jgi:dTDP-3-amino-3,4,6-trideoxy-alpha-D-glucose transaminase
VFADVDPVTLNVTPETVERALTPHTRALLPVHLYGHPVDLDPMIEMARNRGIPLVEDACQAIGAQYKGRPVGVRSGIGALSFYPTKNLGAFGDGGAVVVDDPEVAARLRRLRNGGQSDRYRHEVAGINSRLDEMQAAMLRVKLGISRPGRTGGAPWPRATRKDCATRASAFPWSSPTRVRSTTST